MKNNISILLLTALLLGSNNIKAQYVYDENFCDSIFLKAQDYSAFGKIDSALFAFNQSLQCYSQLKNHKRCGETFNQIAIIYRDKGEYTVALDYFQQSLDVHVSINNQQGIAQTNNSLGILYMAWHKYDYALQYYNKALQIYKTLDFDIKVADVLNNIGLIYKYQSDLDKALECFSESLTIRQKNNDEYKIAVSLHNIGTAYAAKKEYYVALEYYQKAFEINNKNDIKKEIAISLNAIGNVYMNLGDYKLATEYFNKGLEIALAIKNAQMTITLYENMTLNYAALGDYDSFRGYFDLYLGYYDSIYNIDKHRQFLELQTIYETEKKEQKIQSLNREIESRKINNRKNGLILILVFSLLIILLGFAVYFYRSIRLKSELRIKDLNQRLLILQMNPHFIFNSLGAIQDYILNEDPLKASTYLSKFASLMRMILEDSKKDYIKLASEIEMLEYYLNLQKIRFQLVFDYAIQIEDSIDPDFFYIPPMIIQPFVENAIKHGLCGMHENGLISIDFRKESEKLIVEIKDNGIGIKNSLKKLKSEHLSMAIDITKERLYLLQKKHKEKCRAVISNREDGGTIVVLNLPIVNELFIKAYD
ncbi:MAG: tetratricopeptide repeat protein [Bacteroidales bacterium]|nr:tetratricopeptide repeat protein [Bacteroidales bacterium]